MRYSSDHKAQTRTRVLTEAAAAIRTDGVDRVSVARIMSRAGLTHGGFYAHFSSKDDMITQAVGFMFENRYGAFFGRPDQPDPASVFSRFIDWYLSINHRDMPDRGCPIPLLSGQAALLPEGAFSRFVLATERLTATIESLLREMDHEHPEVTAAVVIAEMMGGVAMSRLQRDDEKAGNLLDAIRTSVRASCGLPPSDREAKPVRA